MQKPIIFWLCWLYNRLKLTNHQDIWACLRTGDTQKSSTTGFRGCPIDTSQAKSQAETWQDVSVLYQFQFQARMCFKKMVSRIQEDARSELTNNYSSSPSKSPDCQRRSSGSYAKHCLCLNGHCSRMFLSNGWMGQCVKILSGSHHPTSGKVQLSTS